MTEPEISNHIKLPATSNSASLYLSPEAFPSEDPVADEQLTQSRLNNVQTDLSALKINTKDVPRLMIASTSPGSARFLSPIRSKVSFVSSDEAHLRASIAKLERLLNEAAGLVESTSWPQQQENRLVEGSPENVNRVSDAQPALVSQPYEGTKGDQKALSRRSSPLASIWKVKGFTSLTNVKAAAAAPVLCLPESKSREDLVRISKTSYENYDSRSNDVQSGFHGGNSTTPPQEIASHGQSHNFVSSTNLPSPRSDKYLPAPQKRVPSIVAEADSPSTTSFAPFRVRFQDPKLATGDRTIAIEGRKWRKPSTAPTPAAVGGDLSSDGDEQSDPESPDSPPLQQFDEPLHVTTNELPKLQINGEGVDTWEAILASQAPPPQRVDTGHERHYSTIFGLRSKEKSASMIRPSNSLETPKIDLRKKSHVDVYHEGTILEVHDTCQHSTNARNWPNARKRLTAVVACLNTSCIGLLLGIYTGEVPAIQYAIADFGHFSILGNVAFYTGMAVSSLSFWPLPLLHGRKPYVITAGLIALVLQVPQGLAVSSTRDPSTPTYRLLLLGSRGVTGLVLGISDTNMKGMLLDCFGASLQSLSNSSDRYDRYDARKHGGGMGMWLGFLSWSTVGPISIGFMVGASIIDKNATVAWGFWISICCLLVVLLMDVICPETRRSAFRRMVADLSGDQGPFSRVVRGEVKMHLDGIVKQPGFLVLSVYAGWVYAQYSLVLMLLGALASKDYHFRAALVGLCALAPAIGAVFAMPFQRGSYFSRSRNLPIRSDTFTMKQRFNWSSHFLRRLGFMILLPVCAAAYAATSLGPPLSVAAPCIMAALVGFFTTMATTECYSLIMETFDTTDLQPGMTGRPIRASVDEYSAEQRTSFSCYPRVMASLVITNALGYILAAAATAVTGSVQRREGTVWATTAVAGISLALTLLLTLVLSKWKKVQMIPDGQETLEHLRRANTSWRPVIVGRGSSKFRRLSIFEMGRMTRYSVIRERNRIETGLSGGLRGKLHVIT